MIHDIPLLQNWPITGLNTCLLDHLNTDSDSNHINGQQLRSAQTHKEWQIGMPVFNKCGELLAL